MRPPPPSPLLGCSGAHVTRQTKCLPFASIDYGGDIRYIRSKEASQNTEIEAVNMRVGDLPKIHQ